MNWLIRKGLSVYSIAVALMGSALGGSFQEIYERVQEEYEVGKSKEGGEKLIFFLEDIHTESIKEKNLRKIDFLERNFDLDVVGLEGRLNPDEKETQDEIAERVEETLKVDDAPKLEGASEFDVNPPRGSYDSIIKDGRFKVLGLEDKEVLYHVGLVADAEDIYNQLVEAVAAGYYVPLEQGGKLIPQVAMLLKIQDEIDGFPGLDISQIPYYEGSDTRILHRDLEGAEYFMGCLVRFRDWVTEYMVDPRTRISAGKLMDAMEKGDLEYGAMIFGRGHGDDTTYDVKTTLQKEFEKRGFSYITIKVD